MQTFRISFFTLIFLVGSRCVDAQVFTLKPSAGLNACQVHGDNYSGYDKVGLFAGVAVNARTSDRASLEMGFYFSQKGSRRNPSKEDFSYYRLNLNYIDMPLSLHYFVNNKYFITAGPSVAYLISYRENINYTDFTGWYPFNKFEISVNAGLGRKIKENLHIEVRTTNSIATIRSYGVLANRVFYPNPVARFFNKGFYNNILSFFLTYTIGKSNKNAD
jgi:hypothetical protein